MSEKKTSRKKQAVGDAAVRRVPTQERSKLRLSRILDAADAVFSDAGFDAATMEDIAARAETSIGSVYQFFPHKTALFEALCGRYMERAQQLFEELLVPEVVTGPWRQLVDHMIDAFWRFHMDLPGFRAVWAYQNISPELLAQSDAANVALAERVEQVMATFAPKVARARRRAAAATVVETISAILFVAVRREAAEARVLIAELKVMTKAYLQEVIDRPSSAPVTDKP